MDYPRPRRRRGRQPRLDDDFPIDDPYDGGDFYDREPAYSSPRRHDTEKHRRRPSLSPDLSSSRRAPYGSDEPPASSPSRRRPTRHDPPPSRGRSAGVGPPSLDRAPSPPSYGVEPEPPRRQKRPHRHNRDPDPYSRDTFPREPLPPEPYVQEDPYARDPYARDPYAREPYSQDPHAKDPYVKDPHPHHRDSPRSRGYQPDPRDRSSRAPPPRGIESDYRPRTSRNLPRTSSPDARPRGRSGYHTDPYGGDDYDHPRRRPRSPGRAHDRHASPSRRSPPTTRGREPPMRRHSVPASSKPKAKPWWQNPMIQAGARTALTAGAQAAMKNRHDPSPWLGAKGAKVATAALGAAIVDGFIGQKHSNSMRHNIMRQGVDVASGKVHSSSRR